MYVSCLSVEIPGDVKKLDENLYHCCTNTALSTELRSGKAISTTAAHSPRPRKW
ncbi:hypothetical protein M433DRAFT_387952, partial [Acidomyces richmondensis BFW]